MNHENDTNPIKTTAAGANIRVTPKTKELAENLRNAISEETGVNLPLAAVIGDLVFRAMKERS